MQARGPNPGGSPTATFCLYARMLRRFEPDEFPEHKSLRLKPEAEA